jgi:hypothetical protein
MKQTRKEKCTKETILEEQKRLKKEPYMINVNTWSYVVIEQKEEKKQDKKQDYKKKKSTHKKQNRNVK